MAVDPELLAILVCPKTKGPLELVELKEPTRKALVEKYREKFRDEEPVVTRVSIHRRRTSSIRSFRTSR